MKPVASQPEQVGANIDVTYPGLPCDSSETKQAIEENVAEALGTLSSNLSCIEEGPCSVEVTVEGCTERRKRDTSEPETTIRVALGASLQSPDLTDEDNYSEEEGKDQLTLVSLTTLYC